VNSLLAVAEEARHRYFAQDTHVQVSALLDARMDEMYSANFAWNGSAWTQTTTSTLVKPEAMRATTAGTRLAGNVFTEYGARLTGVPAEAGRFDALPTAAAMLRLAPAMLAGGAAVHPEDALPVYIRDNVAQTTVEREAVKAAKAALLNNQ
jgi:tRNA threonylcarbamoyladenosine biosynthesis protein TsaB